jgi:hypothetical protein
MFLLALFKTMKANNKKGSKFKKCVLEFNFSPIKGYEFFIF